MKLYTLDNKFIKETKEHPHNFTGIIEYLDGVKQWYVEGKLHRLDGPADENPAYRGKQWWQNNKLHRLDGPAVEHTGGIKWWYIDGKRVTKEQCDLLHSMMKLKGLI